MIERLFVYGSLAPGQTNAHVLAEVPGTWEPATVRGRLFAQGWGAAMGYPGIVPDESGDEVPGLVFASAELHRHWSRLDEFEGEGYERVLIKATLEDGTLVDANVYKLNDCSLPPGATHA